VWSFTWKWTATCSAPEMRKRLSGALVKYGRPSNPHITAVENQLTIPQSNKCSLNFKIFPTDSKKRPQHGEGVFKRLRRLQTHDIPAAVFLD
jgi:hypothetical protein